MATTIITKYGSGAPTASDVVRGELAVDTENGRLYTEDSGGSVIEIGLNPSGNVDVTGTVTADGLTVDGGSTVDAITYTANSSFPATGVSLNTNGFSYEMAGTQGKIFRSASNTKALMQITNDGDISFYEDTGTTAKFFWDASAESLTLTGGGLSMDVTAGTVPIDIDTNISSTEGSVDILKAKTINDYYSGVTLVREGSTNTGLAFKTTGSGTYDTRMTIDASGNVGIGTSPSTTLHLLAASTNIRLEDSDTNAYAQVGADNAGSLYLQADNGNGQASSNMYMYVDGTERMRIDSSGNLLVGTTSTVDTNGEGIHVANDTDLKWAISTSTQNRGLVVKTTASTGTHYYGYWEYNGTQVGAITSTGSTTVYATSSDYRLKENVVAMSGATERLKQLKPSRFNFIKDPDTTVDGFLAHEVQDIVPEAVTGTKDAVDAEGNPEYQGIDQSKLVPLLVATIQELEARITQLEGAN